MGARRSSASDGAFRHGLMLAQCCVATFRTRDIVPRRVERLVCCGLGLDRRGFVCADRTFFRASYLQKRNGLGLRGRLLSITSH